MLSEKQYAIIDYLKSHKTISTQEAVNLIGGNIYANKSKYVGLTLSRMVNRELIIRIKKGLFELPNLVNVKLNKNDLFSQDIN